MKNYTKLLMLCFCCGLTVLLSCTRDNPIHTSYDGPLEIRPLCKLASSLSIDEIGAAEAIVSGKGIEGTLTFELLVDRTDSKLYGTLKLPEGATSCDVIIRIYDLQERKIGEGSYSLTQSHFNAGRYVTPQIGIESAKPRIDTVYTRTNSVGINDSIALHAAASDSFGGTIKYEWKCGNGGWLTDGDGDTTVKAPSTAQAYVCSLRVTDDEGNSTYDAVTVTVGARAPVAVAAGDTMVFVNEQVHLYGGGSYDETEIVEFAWKIGGGSWASVSTGDTMITTPGTEQTLVCSLRVSDDDGNIAFGTVSVLTVATSIKDADGNTYTTVIIGTQAWTVENLRTTKYNDETAIPHVTDVTQWSNLSTPGYCWYNNSTVTTEQEKRGALYNWHAVNTGNLAPAGWHVPTDAEWTTLENFLIANGYNWDGTTSGNKIAKSMAARTDWPSSTTAGAIGNDLSKNNVSGFSALPGGYRNGNGDFDGIGSNGDWWSGTESNAGSAWRRYLDYGSGNLGRGGSGKGSGFSVRLLRD